MALSEVQETSYGAIIDLILQHSDLTTVSAKKVRKELADRLGKDLSSYKDDINKLIGQRFDSFSNTSPSKAESRPEPVEIKADPSLSAAANALAIPAQSAPVVASKPKSKPPRAAESDAAMAARLQAEESLRARPTRGGVVKKRAPSAKEKKAAKVRLQKASRAKSGSGSDSNLSELEGGEPKKRNGAFHKPMNLSPALATLLNETALSRPQTVKRIWEYIKAQDLQDPSDRRQIICDDALRAVFKTDRVSMFAMNKVLSQNLYSPEESF